MIFPEYLKLDLVTVFKFHFIFLLFLFSFSIEVLGRSLSVTPSNSLSPSFSSGHFRELEPGSAVYYLTILGCKT